MTKKTPFPFYKFSPSGNITVFLLGNSAEASRYCGEALGESGVGGEQAGMVDARTNCLEMAGGEFCVNACRALAALLALLNPGERRFVARVSGLDAEVALEAEGSAPKWRTRAIFPMPKPEIGENRADFPGISHIFEKTAVFPSREEAVRLGQASADRLTGPEIPAAGHVWWREKNGELEILPFVSVPGAGTAMLESACGSASIGLAALLGRDACHIRQPSGAVLEIGRSGEHVGVAGSVELICRGEIWLSGRF